MLGEQSEEWFHRLGIQGIDLLFLLSFLENEPTFLQGFEIMGDHALFLPQSTCNVTYTLWSFVQGFQYRQTCWVRQGRKEAVARFRQPAFHTLQLT
jgi:PhoPQ-activated pathogenicity-related protein